MIARVLEFTALYNMDGSKTQSPPDASSEVYGINVRGTKTGLPPASLI
jgi:hypothetical protein